MSARIRELREARQWTQADLGERVGSSANYVAQVEKGLAVSEKKLARYGEALGASVPYLRYGVVATVDAEALRDRAIAEGRRQAFAEVTAFVTAASDPRRAPAGDILSQLGKDQQNLPTPTTEKATPARGARGGRRRKTSNGR